MIRGIGGMRAVTLALAVLLPVGVLTGCATATRVGPGFGAASDDRSRIMVTLPSTSPFVVRRSIRELSVAYELNFVASWEMTSLQQQCVVFDMRPGTDLERLVGSLGRDHRIDLAQPVSRFVVYGDEAEDSPRSYRRFQTAADMLRLDQAHAHAVGRGVKVALVDTGVDLSHPDYGGRIVAARDFVGEDDASFTRDLHGTAVAGLVASDHLDGVGMVGVAPGVELTVVKACWPEPPGGRHAICDSYTLALALDYVVGEQARIINLSLGGPDDPILRRLLEVAIEHDTVVVAARPAGGDAFPASMPGVLAVRALPRGGDGLKLDEPKTGVSAATATVLAAPGEEILTTSPGGGYDFWNGSSMAAAQVAGVVALILELRPELKPAEVASLLRDSARDNPGHAVVDACAAVALASGADCR